MLEYFKGTGQPSLDLGKEYESNEIGQALCDWLLEHRKANDITPPPPPPPPDPEPEPEAEKPAPRARKTTRGRTKKTDADN